jgi:glycosyltransferase involved in cell wall biosynthesis
VKVLILHQHFNIPDKGGPLRSYYLAKALISKGHQVSVITGNAKSFRQEVIEGIDIHYLPVPYDNKFGFSARSKSFMQFVFGAIRVSKNIKADICYAISVPLTVGLVAVWNKKRYKMPFIFEVGDLWPDAPIEIGVIKNSFFKFLLFRLEKFIYQQAESIVALSPSIKKRIEEKISRKKIDLITNMADVDFFRPETKDAALEKKYNTSGKFVVSYIGALGVANGLNYFLECARSAQKADLPVQFILCGVGGMTDNLKKSSDRLQLKNISFIGFQNREGVREIMNVTDAVFISYKPIPILETGSPNKYFDGLAAGKLIIVNFGGWIKDEIEKNECGIFIDPKHPSEFVKQITPFLESQSHLKNYQQRARHLAETNYSRKKLSEKFTGIVERSKI